MVIAAFGNHSMKDASITLTNTDETKLSENDSQSFELSQGSLGERSVGLAVMREEDLRTLEIRNSFGRGVSTNECFWFKRLPCFSEYLWKMKSELNAFC